MNSVNTKRKRTVKGIFFQMFPIFVILQNLVTLAICETKIRINPDGGYTNIVVKIDRNVNEMFCSTYIKHLRETITEASAVLNEALYGKAYFKEVTIVVPSHWEDARCRMNVLEPAGEIAYQNADVRITTESPIFGPAPHTQQSKGCGERGDFISFSESFFTNWNSTLASWGNPAKLFVKEWAKFRYGIFDEYGFANDVLYPNFYKVQDKFLPTGTSNTVVKGTWLSIDGTEDCDPASGNCYFDPEGENDEVTCSMGYMPFLSKVKHWCSPEELKMPIAPTKHNILCSTKPASLVIAENSDFSDLSVSNQLQRSLVPTFHVVREPLPKYVLLIETSSEMADTWKWIRKGVQNLVRYDLPDEANVAIVTFNSEARVESGLVSLTSDSARSRVADTIPDSANKLGQTSQGCVTCAVRVAVDQVLSGKESGGHLIVITSGDQRSMSESRMENIKTMIDTFGIRLSSVMLTDDSSIQPLYDSAAQQSGGQTFVLSKYLPVLSVYAHLIEHLRNIVAVDNNESENYPVTLYQKYITSDNNEPINGTFLIDADLGRDTEFGIYVEDDEDHQIKSVTFQDAELNVYGPFTTMSSFYDSVNLKTINFNVGEIPPFDEVSKRGTAWTYKIDWYTTNQTRDNVVLVRSKPSTVAEKGLLSIRAWTNMNDRDTVTHDTLLAVYVEVTRGDSPVLGAAVKMDIKVELNNGSVLAVTNSSMDLVDNGLGEPDIVGGDGVYSRYLTRYPAPGRYSFSIFVDDNNNQAEYVRAGGPAVKKPPKAGVSTCCGSTVPLPANRKKKIGVFKRHLMGPSVEVKNVPLYSEKMRPGKIGDLKITVLKEKQQLRAGWTAPGGDFSDGRVITYRFVFSQKIEELLTPSVNAPALDGLKRSDEPGESVSHDIKFPYYNQDYYVGIFAFDEFGNRGNMSNIVLVSVPAPPAAPPGNENTEPIVHKIQTPWTLIGAIIGAVAVILLLLIFVLYFKFFRVSRSKFSKHSFAKNLKSSGVKVEIPSPPQSESTDASSYESDLKESSTTYIKPQVMNTMSSTSFGNNLTPTYWSASQLLSEHELRKRDQDEYRQMLTNTLGAIHEGHPQDYPDIALYDPASNYGYYPEQGDYGDYYPGYEQHYQPSARHSTSSEHIYDHNRYGDYAPSYNPEGHYNEHINKSSSKLLVNSDMSSSTLGIINPSLQGSQMSVNSDTRDPAMRNITQV